jgi:hypothetical protein
MEDKKLTQGTHQYEPEAWRGDDALPAGADSVDGPTIREQCRLLDLLGRINYRIISGNRVYVEAGGVVYKTLYGGYWRSVFTGIEYYLLRCEKVSDGAWDQDDTTAVDLPIAYSKEGWTTSGHSLSFILNRDFTEERQTFLHRLRKLRKPRGIGPLTTMMH